MKLWILSCIFTFQIFALTPPIPIKGIAYNTKSINLTSGNRFSFHITPPDNWGIADMSALKDGSGFFQLFPINGGFGCKIEIKTFDELTELELAVDNFKKGLPQIKELEDGFETEFQNAWYACRQNNLSLIQIWYSLPKKEKNHSLVWETLKYCIYVSEYSPDSKIDIIAPIKPYIPEESFSYLIEPKTKAYSFDDPDKTYRIFFIPNIEIKNCTSNELENNKYLLQFDHRYRKEFFYIKWDADNLDTETPYKNHLIEMSNDIIKIEENQRFYKNPIYYNQDDCAIWEGFPYTLISLKGDNFLFGFAIYSQFGLSINEMNRLIEQVSWKEL